MGFLYYLTLVPQALAILHFFKYRPEGYWFWIILFFGPLGAVIYFFAVVLSDSPGAVGDKLSATMRERKQVRRLKAKVDSGQALPYDYSELGEIQFKLKKFEDAVSNLTAAVEKSPENHEARYFLGLALERLGRYEQGGRQLEPIVLKDPKYKFGDALLALARCYHGAGEDQAAIAAYKKVLSQSDFAEARYNLAELLIARGDKDEAKRHLEDLIKEAAIADLPSYQSRQEKKWVKKAKARLAGM